MRASSLFLATTVCFMTIAGSAFGASPKSAPQSPRWQALSLREKIGQTVILLTDPDEEMRLGEGSLEGFLKKYPVAGFFVGSWKFGNIPGDAKGAAIRERIEAYSSATKTPLFFQEDYEQGPGSGLEGFTHLSPLMGLAATDSEALAFAYGKILANESRTLGFNWLFNPVADISLNSLNPLVSTRCASDSPEKVIKILRQQIAGMTSSELISTIKHFPGDGVDFRDQHLVTTTNSLRQKQWWATYGKVYRELIRAGAPSIMIGHITLPALQTRDSKGRYLPASLSKELITNVLKGKLGFKGVVISDALNMGGIQGYYPTPVDTQIEAFKAGTDLLLWPSLDYIDRVEKLISEGKIPMKRLNDAVSRVWALKEKFGLLKLPRPVLPPLQSEPSESANQVVRQIAEKSLTLRRDRQKLLPLKSSETPKVLLTIVAPQSSAEKQMKQFAPLKTELEARGFQVTMRTNLSFYESDLNKLGDFDRYIFAFNRRPHSPIGTLQLYETEALTVWSINTLSPNKVISVSFGDPYVHDTYLPHVGTCLNAYGDSVEIQKAVAKALNGEIKIQGISPVK